MTSADADRRARRLRTRGFTLIEVLAALVIVALGMLGVIQAVTQSARNGTYLREKTLAHWIAMNVITERRLLAAPPDVAESSDDVEFAGQRWRWTMTVTQTEVESLRRMDVAVRPADRPDGEALATVTGFYGTAIGAIGGGTLPWANGQPAAGDGADDGGDEEGNGQADDRPQRPTDANDGNGESFTERVRRNRQQPPAEEE
jgi:general secretion pathway protein I